MPNTFYPKRSVMLPASKPHPENTQYKISIGDEDWDGELQTVIKIQLVYNGKIAGRKAPSYPYDSDDAERVAAAIVQIKKDYSDEPNIQYIPAAPTTKVPIGYYIALLRLVPPGYITRWEDIEAYIKTKLGLDVNSVPRTAAARTYDRALAGIRTALLPEIDRIKSEPA